MGEKERLFLNNAAEKENEGDPGEPKLLYFFKAA